MKLGIVENVLMQQDEAASFRLAKRLGLDGVEVMLSRRDLHEPDRPRLQRLKEAKSTTGVQIPSVMLVYLNQGSLSSDRPEVVQAAKEDIRIAIDWSAELGAEMILLPFFSTGEIITKDDFQRTLAAFRELCPVAEAHGIQLGFESTLSASDIRRMAELVNSPAFRCYFDLANVVWRGMDTATEIRALGNLIAQVHMKEARSGSGDAPPGLGRVDYAASAEALREIGYDGWLVLETPAAPPELIARDISFTRRHFPGSQKEDWPRTGTFSWDFKRGQWAQMVKAFQQYGLTAVQISGELLQEAVEHPDSIPGWRKQLEDAGISVAALGAYRNLVAFDEEKRKANIDFVKRCLEIASLFGTAVVATETGSRNPHGEWQASPDNIGAEAQRLLHTALEELLPVAQQHGSILALEGFVNNVLQNAGHLLGILEKYPVKNLQVVCDPYNYISQHLIPASERITRDFLQRFEHRFVLAHLKDVSDEGAGSATPEFGHGIFPQKPYLEFLREYRPDLPLILEHLPFDHIPAAIQRIHAVLGTAGETL